MSKYCVIGDVVTDVTLPQDNNEIKVRLGGITHCIRALWALGVEYSAGYFAPQYLDESIITYFNHHDAIATQKLGNVLGAPYTFLIGSVKETSNQLYEFLLRDQIQVTDYSEEAMESIEANNVLLISGNYDLEIVNSALNNDIKRHIDLSNNIDEIDQLGNQKYETIFLSTSSNIFKKYYQNSFSDFAKLFAKNCNVLVLKENRGGTRIYDYKQNTILKVPSITQPIQHSVGVGDVFNACYISKYETLGVKAAAYLSSWVAAEYALTTFVDDFKYKIGHLLKVEIGDLISMGGCFLPWEDRQQYSIYIAAPDFDYIDVTKIDELAESLSYHNFKPRRPIAENGQLTIGDTKSTRQQTCQKDVDLIHECTLLIAVYISDDPGTMIEVGYAKAFGIPCLVFDPYSKAYNCMLTELPDFVSSDLDQVISEVFTLISKINESK